MQRFPHGAATMALTALMALLTALAGSAAADSTDTVPTRIVYQDTVVVSASKLGLRLADLATTATVISPRQIKLGTARGAQEVLASVPGTNLLDMTGSESGGALEARGFAAQGTTSPIVVLVDGLPVNDFESGRVDWSLLTPAQLDHVEFLRGPASFLYGTAAMAGLVQLATLPAGDGAAVWGQASGGDEGRASGAAGTSWGGARMRGSLSGSYQKGDGSRDNSKFAIGNGYGFARASLSPHWNLGARLLAHQGNQDIPGPLAEPDWRTNPSRTITPNDRKDDHTYDGALELNGDLTPRLALTALGSGNATDVDAVETIFPVGTLNRRSRMRSDRAETRLHWTPFGRSTPDFLVGAEYRGGTLTSSYADPSAPDTPTGAGDVRRTTGGVFALTRLPFASVATFVAGGRIDWLRSSLDDVLDSSPRFGNNDLRAISPTAGVNVALPRGGHGWLSYSGAFKAPELEQLYDQRPYDFGGGPFLISSKGLQPQRGDHWDAGARASVGGGAWLDLAGYYARSRNEMGFDFATFQLANIARSKHYGVETELELAPVHGFSGTLSYAWTRAIFEGGPHDGHQINTVPEQSAFARASWEHAWRGSLSAEVGYTGRQWIDEDGVYPIPAATVVNVGAAQAVGALELFVTARNIADKHYASVGYVTVDSSFNPLPLYFPAAGRSFVGGIRMRLSRPGGAGHMQ